MTQKNIHNSFFYRYLVTILSLFAVFLIPILVYITVKPQRIINNQTNAVASEKEVRFEPVTNKISKDFIANVDFSEFKDNIPANWSVYAPTNAESLTLQSINDNKYTYVKNSSLLMESADENTGIEQRFSSGINTPVYIQANVLVQSGKFRLVVLDKDGQEISSDTTTDDKILPGDISADNILPYWQRLAIGVTDPNVIIGSIRLVSSEPDAKAYVTNVVAHPYADYTDLFKDLASDTIGQNLSDCLDKNGEEYISCITDKTGLPQDRWSEIGVPKIYWNGNEVAKDESSLETQSVKKTQKNIYPQESNNLATKTYEINYIHFATDFVDKSDPANPTYFQEKVKDYIQNAWKGQINKEISLDKAIIKPFDPTVKSACKIVGYWFSISVYLPDVWCQKDKNELQYTFLRMSGSDGFRQNNPPRIFVDTSGEWKDLKYTIKHETGHALELEIWI